jgi:membrane protease YdiL (CAAX protease family)
LNTLPLGLAARYLRERTGSVRATIALHLVHNAIAYRLLMIG